MKFLPILIWILLTNLPCTAQQGVLKNWKISTSTPMKVNLDFGTSDSSAAAEVMKTFRLVFVFPARSYTWNDTTYLSIDGGRAQAFASIMGQMQEKPFPVNKTGNTGSWDLILLPSGESIFVNAHRRYAAAPFLSAQNKLSKQNVATVYYKDDSLTFAIQGKPLEEPFHIHQLIGSPLIKLTTSMGKNEVVLNLQMKSSTDVSEGERLRQKMLDQLATKELEKVDKPSYFFHILPILVQK